MAKKKEQDKLSQEVTAALAAGMSYGKWKALQNPVSITRSLPEGWRICAWCGRSFKPTTKRKQLYCESYCQRAAQQERNTKKKEE